MSVRELLQQTPTSFLELLDLFEAYLSTIDDPIMQGVHLLRDGFGERLTFDERGDINVLMMRPVNDANDMRRWLKHLRNARLATDTIQIEMSHPEARVLAFHLRQATNLLYDASDAIDLVKGKLNEAEDALAPGVYAVLSLSARAISDGAERQGAQFRKFAKMLDHATADQQEEDTE